ncbi:AAA family ATPase [Paraburkholderia youngii]|uniref:AAA family ATPase n=1 Tax=Paraburkholderia youngii TaxID=2782701 RepID=UPI003D25CFB5
MRSLTKTSAYALAWLVPIFWACLMVGSFKVPGPLTEPETLRLLIWTVLAAASVKYYAGDRWPLTQAAFIVLCAGVVRLIFAFNVYSLAGVAIALLAAGWMTFEHRRRLPAPVAALTPASAPFTPAAAQPYSPPNYAARGQAPSAPPAAGQGPAPASARYDFTHKFKAPGHNFSRVLGMAETKERLLNAAFEIVNSEDGAKPRNGIMLDGDPGNGKTFLAEALAGELQLPFFGATYNDIATMYVGEPIEKLTVLFQQVVARAPCVLFLDEFDSFMAARAVRPTARRRTTSW